MTRRHFALLCGASAQFNGRGPDLSEIPNFCCHEHWGSIDSIGSVPEGFRADVEAGAVPHGKTGLVDLLFDPYFRGMLGAAGTVVKPAELKELSAWEALASMRRGLEEQQFTGTFQCLRRGVAKLYGVDLAGMDADACKRLDAAIARNYEAHFDWYRRAMREAHFSELIRPVHPEYYVRRESAAAKAEEVSFTHTVMRIDPLLTLWQRQSPRRDNLAALAGIEPADGKSWRAFIAGCFDLAAAARAVGIKQLQAYRRDLDFVPRTDSEVVWRGDLTPSQVRVFQDWVVHECAKQAHDRGWPQQVHVGTHNLTQSSPMPLARMARRYGRMKIVMLHCWPFLEEAGWLAKYEPNIYIDTCWQPVLNPQFLREALRRWLTYVPSHKITAGHDSTSVEMAVGSSLFTREILSECVAEINRDLGMTETSLVALAANLLQNNAVRVYGIGKPA